MTATAHQPITRMVPRDEFVEVLNRHEQWVLILNDVTVGRVRDTAAQFRAGDDLEHSPALADDLDALCDRVEATPVGDWDRPNPTAEHQTLMWQWITVLRERFPLLEAFTDDLNTLRATKDPGVIHARRALALLPAAEAAWPGADAALRPLLALYAAEETR
jgi:hypothetical protein